ncbi:MAG: hypothetical protein ABSF15_24740 [Candidatus Sulfotelmatobacter sp.]
MAGRLSIRRISPYRMKPLRLRRWDCPLSSPTLAMEDKRVAMPVDENRAEQISDLCHCLQPAGRRLIRDLALVEGMLTIV